MEDIIYKPKIYREGIPVFSDDRYWSGEVEERKMESYLEMIARRGFLFFKDKVFSENKKFYDFIFSSQRADWRFCLPFKKNWKVLDIGAGLGANSFAMAKETARVYSLEQSFLRAKFLELRKKAENQENIEVLVADALKLPFYDNSFDLIVANGLLEWLGMTNRFQSPKEAQERFLKEAWRVLKKEGYLYIGIENRFAAAYLFGGKDHSGLRYTSWLPRFLANFYTKLRTGRKYQTYTYSKKGYEKILEKAGFKKSWFYLVSPGYNVPKYIVPYDFLPGLKFIVHQISGGISLRKKILKKMISFPGIARWWRFVFFSFAIFAQK